MRCSTANSLSTPPTGRAVELPGETVSVERSPHALVERDSETVLGVTFLASEYSTGRIHD